MSVFEFSQWVGNLNTNKNDTRLQLRKALRAFPPSEVYFYSKGVMFAAFYKDGVKILAKSLHTPGEVVFHLDEEGEGGLEATVRQSMLVSKDLADGFNQTPVQVKGAGRRAEVCSRILAFLDQIDGFCGGETPEATQTKFVERFYKGNFESYP